MRVFRTLCLGLFLATLISACSDSVIKEDTHPPLVSQNEALKTALDQENWAEAKALIESELAKKSPKDRQQALLFLAQLELRLGDWTSASQRVSELNVDDLTDDDRVLLAIIQWHNELILDNAYDAIDALKDISSNNPYIDSQRLELLATAQGLVGRRVNAVNTRIALNVKLDKELSKLQNEEKIWALLNDMPFDDLLDMMPPPPDALGGWIELNYITRQYQRDLERQNREIALWKDRYPTHPANDRLLYQYLAQLQLKPYDIQHLAVMLPFSGKLAGVGEAIRNGLLYQYFRQDNPPINIQFYDSADEQSDILALYEKAVADGAQLVIGPLQKEQVYALAIQQNLPVPVLALNTLSEESLTTPTQFFQFGLAPEHDALSVADMLKQHQKKQVAVLVPSTDWGARISQSFTEAFTDDTHHVVAIGAYNAKSPDHGQVIRKLTHIDQSHARKQRIQSLSGVNLEFEPRRRDDIEAVFIAATPNQARLLKPQLKFHRAGDLPVYATSHANSADGDHDKNKDLNGLYFVDIPLLISPSAEMNWHRLQLAKAWPSLYRSIPRLIALGADAFKIHEQLPILLADHTLNESGLSGVLSVNQRAEILRHIDQAQFQNNEAVWLAPQIDQTTEKQH